MTDGGLLGSLNRMFAREAGGSLRPPFFDIDATYPALRLLDRKVATIQQELYGVLRMTEKLPRYHEVLKSQTYVSGSIDPEKSWRVFMLLWVSGGVRANQERCPGTVALLKQVPGVLQAFFSILEAGKSIPAHDGPYVGYLRYHLALKVPKVDPPSMRVKDQVHTWKEGQSILFDDSWNHEVFNKSSEVRVVLIVDILRPMGWKNHTINWLVTRVLARYSEEAREAKANLAKFS